MSEVVSKVLADAGYCRVSMETFGIKIPWISHDSPDRIVITVLRSAWCRNMIGRLKAGWQRPLRGGQRRGGQGGGGGLGLTHLEIMIIILTCCDPPDLPDDGEPGPQEARRVLGERGHVTRLTLTIRRQHPETGVRHAGGDRDRDISWSETCMWIHVVTRWIDMMHDASRGLWWEGDLDVTSYYLYPMGETARKCVKIDQSGILTAPICDSCSAEESLVWHVLVLGVTETRQYYCGAKIMSEIETGVTCADQWEARTGTGQPIRGRGHTLGQGWTPACPWLPSLTRPGWWGLQQSLPLALEVTLDSCEIDPSTSFTRSSRLSLKKYLRRERRLILL